MKIRPAIRKISSVGVLILIVAVCVGFLPFQTPHVSAAMNTIRASIPKSFTETVGGSSYTWKNASPWYTDPVKNRLDTGKWVVKEGAQAIGTIDVGINEFTSGNGNPGWAVDITTSLHGINLPHEIIETAYPNDGRFQHESPWGFADSFYGPNNPFSIISSPSDGPFPMQLVEATGSNAHPMYRNMAHHIAEQTDAYRKLVAIDQGSARGTIGLGQPIAGSITPNIPSRAAILLSIAGAVLTLGGGAVNGICNTNRCGKNSKTWAAVGGMFIIIGGLCLAYSGVNVDSWRVALPIVGAATEGIRATAMSEEMVSRGASFASTAATYGTSIDVETALPVPGIG